MKNMTAKYFNYFILKKIVHTTEHQRIESTNIKK